MKTWRKPSILVRAKTMGRNTIPAAKRLPIAASRTIKYDAPGGGRVRSEGGLMNWKRRLGRNLLLALLCGVLASALYWGLLYTRSFHKFSVIMLGPASEFASHHLPYCGPSLSCTLEFFAVNAALYAFWIAVVLVSFDLVSLLKRK